MKKSIFPALGMVGLIGMGMASMARADVEVGAPVLQAAGDRTVVKFSLKNTFKQPVRDARAWVFLLDAEGKVVGNQAQWVVGGGQAGTSRADALSPEQTAQCVVAVPTPKPAVSAQITFSRIVLADGSTADPQRHVKATPSEGAP